MGVSMFTKIVDVILEVVFMVMVLLMSILGTWLLDHSINREKYG